MTTPPADSPTWPPLRNAYTHAPQLHANLLLSSLQLLVWLLFHSSAWRNFVNRIDPTLPPNFALAQLTPAQWRHPALRRLLIQGFVILPLLSGVLVALTPWWALGLSGRNILVNLLITLSYAVATGLAVAISVSVAVGIIYGLAIGLAVGLVPFGAAGLTTQPLLTLGTGLSYLELFGIVRVIFLGLAAGIAGNIATTCAGQQRSYSMLKQIMGVIFGLAVSVLLLLAAFAVASGQLLGSTQPGRVGDELAPAMALFFGAAGGVLFGLAFGLTVAVRTRRPIRGLVIGLLIGLMGGSAYGVAVAVGIRFMLVNAVGGMGGGLLFGGLFAFAYTLAERIAGSWAGATVGAFVSGLGWAALYPFIFRFPVPFWTALPLVLFAIMAGLTLTWWRPVFFYFIQTIWNSYLLRHDEKHREQSPSAFRANAAFWDEHQRLPLLGLDEHLVMIAQRHQHEAQAAFDYLTASHQRWAVQAAQVELEARWLDACNSIAAIGKAYRGLGTGELVGPASALLRSFNRVSQDVLAALRQESAYNQRLALRAVEDRLDNLVRELTRSSEPYAVRFRTIASNWRHMIAQYRRELAATVEQRQEINSPYVIGVPLTAEQEIFVGRTDISARIEQLLLDQRRLPLLLYGQRRMGKTSLLNNLGRLLPSTILPLFVDLQGPATQASDQTGFLYNLARGMITSAQRQRALALPPLSREQLADDPFTRFDEWLEQLEELLGPHTALLALDEFEALEIPMNQGRFDESAIMNMFRHIIQHRPRFKILLTGSHSLEEFGRWASYLINVQIVQISYLSEAETQQLIERPVQDFALRYEPEASRRIFALTRGHPFLVQLLCAEVVALKNEQDPAVRRLANLADVETAAPAALSHGSFFFADIQRNQLDSLAPEILRWLALQGEGATVDLAGLSRHFPTGLEEGLATLTRRQLIEPANGGYRFQVELIRRWFAQL
jgi:hypothetical protein